jgi:hypothetical protein
MGGRGSRLAMILVAASSPVLGTGCGSEQGTPQLPVHVAATISRRGARAEPDRVGFEQVEGQRQGAKGEKLLVVFRITNRLNHPSMLEVHAGPYVSDDVNSMAIPAHGVGALRTTLATGVYQLNGDEIPTQTNGELTVGPYRRQRRSSR